MPDAAEKLAVAVRPLSLEDWRSVCGALDHAYVVLDACDEPRVPAKAAEYGDRAATLYAGRALEEYSAIAPYLFQLDRPLLDWIERHLWKDPFGIFVVAPVDLAVLRKHFRRFLTVQLAGGRQVLFRFYDPRVLPTFLSTCTPEECEQFFGPVDQFLVVDKNALSALSRVGARGVAKNL